MANKRSPSKKPKPKKEKKSFGIAEWYGQLYRSLNLETAQRFASQTAKGELCPFFVQVPALAPKKGQDLRCSKSGGICSIRNFREAEDGGHDFSQSPISATCPNRFLERGVVIRHIGRLVLETDTPKFAKEIAFLMREGEDISVAEPVPEVEPLDESADDNVGVDGGIGDSPTVEREDVGKIDLVLVNPEKPDLWCAVEIQAVYFSGGEMGADIKSVRGYNGNGLPGPAKPRRPDFRSSGPKRLMPQLMIKVPTLRRWGKKMVVVIDQPFARSMGKLEVVDHISNCDIVWLVVNFDDTEPGPEAKLQVADRHFATLEESIKWLTAGKPTNLPDFQNSMLKKVAPAFS